VRLADPVTVKMLLGWAAGVVVALFVAAMSCGSTIVTRAEAAAGAQVRLAEKRADEANDHVDKVEKRIDDRLNRIEGKVDEILKRGLK
jgi:hypothetical protein